MTAATVSPSVAALVGQFGAARIIIEGHTDASMKGNIPEQAVISLSQARADAMKTSLLRKFKTLQPNQFATQGLGWSSPADPNDPLNHAKNRRVEVKVYPLEAQ